MVETLNTVGGRVVYKKGRFCADKVEYNEGIRCCIWMSLGKDVDTDAAFNFDYADIDDLLVMLNHLKTVEPEKAGE
jgi:hypothetical protein